jgi:predicted ester cyclase
MKMEMTMTTDAEALVRRAYHLGEGATLDPQAFAALFAQDGVIHAGARTYRGAELGPFVASVAAFAPDVHRELHRVVVQGKTVVFELSIQGTFSQPFVSPAGSLPPNGARLDVPCADFWVVEDGKIKEFNCHVDVSMLLEQMGVKPDFASAVKAAAA